jgi:hypothetical protein
MDESWMNHIPTVARLNRFDFPALWGEVLESLIVHARDRLDDRVQHQRQRYMLTPWYFEDLWHFFLFEILLNPVTFGMMIGAQVFSPQSSDSRNAKLFTVSSHWRTLPWFTCW